MRFTSQFLDELKARLPVSEVVGRRVKLVRAGREFKGLSPFNKEKTPSFFVNDQKQAWFDFSSGKNGSIFDFVMESEGVSFPEAVERLAQMAGVPLPKVSREDEARDARRKTLHDVMELAAKFFQDTLASRNGAKARGLSTSNRPATTAFADSVSITSISINCISPIRVCRSPRRWARWTAWSKRARSEKSAARISLPSSWMKAPAPYELARHDSSACRTNTACSSACPSATSCRRASVWGWPFFPTSRSPAGC